MSASIARTVPARTADVAHRQVAHHLRPCSFALVLLTVGFGPYDAFAFQLDFETATTDLLADIREGSSLLQSSDIKLGDTAGQTLPISEEELSAAFDFFDVEGQARVATRHWRSCCTCTPQWRVRARRGRLHQKI